MSQVFLTQPVRQKVNDLTVNLNSKISAAVQRAGDQVVFVDYDDYVGLLGGRFCEPGVDESKGNGANRDYLFFYESKSTDTPFFEPNYDPHDELRRRDGNSNPPTIADPPDAEVGDWMSDYINANSNPQLNEDVSNSDLDNAVRTEEQSKKARKRSPIPINKLGTHERHRISSRVYPGANSSVNQNLSSLVHGNSSDLKTANLTDKFRSSEKHAVSKSLSRSASTLYPHPSSFRSTRPSGFPAKGVNSSANNATRVSPSGVAGSRGYLSGASNRTFSTAKAKGTGDPFVGIGPHDKHAGEQLHENSVLRKLLVPDSWIRVFHPNQFGHVMVANLVLYAIAAQNAKSMGQTYPPQNLTIDDASCPLPPAPACNGSGTDAWAGRDAVVSAAEAFCGDFTNMVGSPGKTASATFNDNSLDYLSLSITYNDGFNLGEDQCESWFDSVADSCDTNGMAKHGGSIGYAANATLSIDPLVVRAEFDGGKASNIECYGVSNNRYVTQGTLAANIQDYCAASAAQPNGIAYGGLSFNKPYNANTPDYMTLTTAWPQGPRNFQIFEDECIFYMNSIMNGCDVPGDVDNPMNWKHGGTIKDNNGVFYMIAPNTQNRPPAPPKPVGSCTTKYKGLYTRFEVYGGGWADSAFGSEPNGLHTQIGGCGSITKWKFEYYASPAPDNTEWHAWGNLPILTSWCVGRAIATSGGFTDGCYGNG